MDNVLVDALERLVDTNDIYTVVYTLSRICGEKADHLRANWQDRVTAKEWDKAAKSLDTAAAKIFKTGL